MEFQLCKTGVHQRVHQYARCCGACCCRRRCCGALCSRTAHQHLCGGLLRSPQHRTAVSCPCGRRARVREERVERRTRRSGTRPQRSGGVRSRRVIGSHCGCEPLLDLGEYPAVTPRHHRHMTAALRILVRRAWRVVVVLIHLY